MFLACAAIGMVLLVVQVVMMVIGLDNVDDPSDTAFSVDDAAGGDAFFGYLSLKTVVAFLAFFGLTGLAVENAAWASATWVKLAVASSDGLLAFLGVAYLMKSFMKLQSQGNVELKNAVGQQGIVYLTIPAYRAGMGQVTVVVQQRTMQIKAITQGTELKTGVPIRVVGQHGADVVEVAAV